jgi:uncharacterized protein (TIGR01244 family)
MRNMTVLGRSVITFFLLSGLTLAPAQDNTGKQPEDLPRYLEVTPSIGTGAQMTNDGIKQLAEKGYGAIINLRTASEGADLEAEQKTVEAAGMAYFAVPLSGKDPDPAQAERFLDLMKSLSGKRVFVHCATANRAGSLMMIKRVLQDDLSVDDATAEAVKIGLKSDTLKQFALEVTGRLKQ